MSQSSKFSAFLAYLLLVFGWIYVIVARRNDRFAIYHTRQSIALVLVAVGVVIIWMVFAWVVTWIPFAGQLLAAASFALVMLAYILLFVFWLMGMRQALTAQTKPLPLAGRWTRYIPLQDPT